MGQTKGTYSSPEEVKSFMQQLKKEKVTRLRRLEQIKERQRKKEEQRNEQLKIMQKKVEEEKMQKRAQEHQEFENKVGEKLL